MFLRFVWGRDRLPNHSVWEQKMILSYLPSDPQSLPLSSTCFFMLKIPKYNSKEELKEKLLLAICNCNSFSFI